MKTSNLKLENRQILQPVMTILPGKTEGVRKPRMIRIYVEDFNNHPISYANVKLTSGAFSTQLKYDRETKTYVTRKFASDRYDLEVTAEHFETHCNNFFVPKSGTERIVCLAK
ncbi:MAG: hypothetical protein ACM3PT_11290 [Deltaproteobacteria bacterium]